jgi:hypothetical protein
MSAKVPDKCQIRGLMIACWLMLNFGWDFEFFWEFIVK